jgi:hypothetical protein
VHQYTLTCTGTEAGEQSKTVKKLRKENKKLSEQNTPLQCKVTLLVDMVRDDDDDHDVDVSSISLPACRFIPPYQWLGM